MLIQGLRVTPFTYYSNMMFDTMLGEKSYDALPNFTAADCESTNWLDLLTNWLDRYLAEILS